MTNKLPRSIVNLVLLASFAPLVLMLLGVDFSSSAMKLNLDSLQGLNGSEVTDVVHHSLQGSYVHTLLEWSALCVALLTAVLAFVHYRIVKDVTTPLIAMALLASGAMDAFHTLAADRLIESVADNRNLIPFTWAICRVFNATILFIGVGLLLWRKKEQIKIGAVSNFLLITSLGFMTLAYVVIHYSAVSGSLPQTQFPDSLITRPWDLAPLALYAIAGVFLYPKFFRHNKTVFAHALVIGVIPAIMTQAHMAFGSSSLFDSNFNVAHYLKIISYLVPMSGLLYDYLMTHRINEQVVLQLEDEVMERRISQEKLLHIGRELRESKEKIAQRTAYLEGVFSSSNAGMILTTDTEGVVILMSAGCEGMLGYEREAVCGKKNIVEFIQFDAAAIKTFADGKESNSSSERWKSLTALARVGITDRNERQIISKTGDLCPVDLSISSVFRDNGQEQEVEGFLFYGIDIHEAKEREELVINAGMAAAEAQEEALNMAEESENRRKQLEEAVAQIELAQMELKNSQQRIEEVTSTINEAIWSMDPETQSFTYLSEACETIFGYPPGDYMNRPDLLEDAIHPEDMQIYVDNLSKLGLGQRVDFDFRITHVNGDYKWVKAIASPIEFKGDRASRVTGSFSDITELREATEALTQSESRVRAILENVVDGITTLDSSGKIQMSNPAMTSLLGYSAEELSCKSITDLVTSEKEDFFSSDSEDFMRKTMENAANDDDRALIATAQNGRKFPIEISFSEFIISDKQFYIAVMRDITERIAHQAFLSKAEKNIAISALAAGVAHEFKNCLGGIMGNATLALDYPGETELVTGSLDEIVKISDKANKIALSLLSYSQVGETDGAITVVHTTLKEAIVLLENECKEKNVRLRVDVEEQLCVSIDPSSLQQCVISITRNAIESFESGGVVQIRGFKEQEFGVVEIRDSGCGMDEEELNRAFDPFYSSKGVWGNDANPGQGLGLTTAKNIVENAGGAIELRSRKGSGTAVEIRLPLAVIVQVDDQPTQYQSADDMPGLLLHRYADSSADDVAATLDELKIDWRPVVGNDDIEQVLAADIGIVLLDGMVPFKIEFARMFETIREKRPDIRIVVVVDAVYDYYIAEYVQSADFILHRPITDSSLSLALSMAYPAQKDSASVTT